MTECPLAASCHFFNHQLKDKPKIAKMFRNRYCLSDSSKCALYLIASRLNSNCIPNNLYPNQIDQALALIETSGE